MRLKDRLRRGKGNGWSGRQNRFTRNTRLEQLEERQMLSAENLFAQFVGIVEQTSDVEQIPISIAPEKLGITSDEVYLGFQTHTREGNSFDPDAVRIIAGDGAAVTPAFSRDDLAGSTDSVVVAGLSAGNYTMEVFGEVPDRSQYLVDVYLVGDVDGDHVVDSDDLDSIRGMYGSRAGDDRYQLAADANLDGRISAMDLTLARRNEVAGEPADNLLEQFDGVLRQPTDTGQISINVDLDEGSANDQVYFAFQTRGLGGGDLDPDALQIRDADGEIVSPQYTVTDLPGSSDSVVVAALAAGDYTLEVSGNASTRSHYQVDMFLAGDVNGDHVVDRDDLSAIRNIYGSSAGDDRYQLAADANLDGRINAMDYVLARRNQIAAVPTITGGESISVDTSTSKSCSLDVVTDNGWGTVYDRVSAVTPADGYKSDAAMKFYESQIGWVQPLSSPTAPQGGVFYVPEDPTVTVTWTGRESDFGNDLVMFTVDEVDGTIYVDERSQALVTSCTEMTVLEGEEETFTVRLLKRPTANVTVSIAIDSGDTDLSVDPSESELTFTIYDWFIPQVVTIIAAEDGDSTHDTAEFKVSSSGLADVMVTANEQDNDAGQGLVVSATELSVPEGGESPFAIRLSQDPGAEVTVTVNINKQSGDDDLSADRSRLTFTTDNWDEPQTVTLSASADEDSTNGTAVFQVASSGLTSVTITATEDEEYKGTPIQPDEGGYANAAAARSLLTLDSPDCYDRINIENNNVRPDPNYGTRVIPAGTYYSFYLVQGCYEDEDTATPQNYKWFFFPSANVDGYQHFQEVAPGDTDYVEGVTTFRVEDLSNDRINHPNPADYYNDADFDDVIFSVDVEYESYSLEGMVFEDFNGNGALDIDSFDYSAPYTIFLVDISDSVIGGFGDSSYNSVLDAERSGLAILAQAIRDQGSNTQIAVIPFASTAAALDVDPDTAGTQYFALATADTDGDQNYDVNEVVLGLETAVGPTYFNVAFEAVISMLEAEFPSTKPDAGEIQIVMVTDGWESSDPPSYETALSELCGSGANDWGANLSVVGMGYNANLAALRSINPEVQRASSYEQLLGVFQPDPNVTVESPLAGWFVYLDLDNDDVYDLNEPFRYTDENGWYEFSDLDTIAPGLTVAYVRCEERVGWSYSSPADRLHTIYLSEASQTTYGVDFGVAETSQVLEGTISGCKYLDTWIENGIRDIGGIIEGFPPDIVFIIDVSGSTCAPFVGDVPVDDLNGDGRSNTILDAEIAAFIGLNDFLIGLGYGGDEGEETDWARIGIVAFSSDAQTCFLGGQLWTYPVTPEGHAPYVEQTLYNLNSGGGTNYYQALEKATTLFAQFNASDTENERPNNLIFISDGYPNPGNEATTAQITYLRETLEVDNIRAYGAGAGASLSELLVIDPDDPTDPDDSYAEIFLNPDELVGVFSGLEPGKGGSYCEPGVEDWAIYLYWDSNGDGEITGYELFKPYATAVTDENGNYSFTDLPAGKFLVREQLRPFYRQTGPDSVNDPPEHCEIVQGDYQRDYIVTLGAWEEAEGVDFGNVPTSYDNSPPEFNSTLITNAEVGTTYYYESTATDDDNDRLTFSLPENRIIWPEGFTPTAEQKFNFTDMETEIPDGWDDYGIITWDPPAELVGQTVTIFEVVVDTAGNKVSRPIEIYVSEAEDNSDPNISPLPPDNHYLPVDPVPLDDPVWPEYLAFSLNEDQSRTFSVSIDLSQISAPHGYIGVDTVFIVDESTSMQYAHEWLAEVVLQLDYEYKSRGFGNISGNDFGLVGFGDASIVPRQIDVGGTDSAFGNAEQLATAISNLHDNGEREDGYYGIDYALDYPFRTNALINLVLITDDDRDVVDSGLDFQSLLADLSTTNNVTLNTIVSLSCSADDTIDDVGYASSFTEVQGTWTVEPLSYTGEPDSSGAAALSIATSPLKLYGRGLTHSSISVADNAYGGGKGFVVFDYEDDDDFKFAGFDTRSNEWIIGIRTPSSWIYHKQEPAGYDLIPGVRYEVSVFFDSFGQSVTLFVDGLEATWCSGFDQWLKNNKTMGVGALDAAATFGFFSSGVCDISPSEHTYHTVFAEDFGGSSALGVTSGHTAYIASGIGGYYLGINGEFSGDICEATNIIDDYVSLAWQMGGSAWDIKYLRGTSENDPVRQSFSKSFAHALGSQTAAYLGIHPEVDEEGIDFSYDTINAGYFSATFTGDGRAHNFCVEFRTASDDLVAEIPVAVNAAYDWDFVLEDDDGDPVTIEWTEGSDNHGALLDNNNNNITWNPTEPGSYDFSITLKDDRGGITVYPWTVEVKDEDIDNPNHAPEITGSTPNNAMVRRDWAFQVEANDDDQEDKLRYFLIEKPGYPIPLGMEIDRDTGMIRWTPTLAQGDVGSFTFWVRVYDGRYGGEDEQEFTVLVDPQKAINHWPYFLTDGDHAPICLAVVDEPYFYDAAATDLDGDDLTFDLHSGPDGMTVNKEKGYVSWTPSKADYDNQEDYYNVVLKVTDKQGGTGYLPYTILVLSNNRPPTIKSEPTNAGTDGEFVYPLEVEDLDGDPVTCMLLERPDENMKIEKRVIAGITRDCVVWENPISGTHHVVIFADDGNEWQYIEGQNIQELDLEVYEYSPPRFEGEIPQYWIVDEAGEGYFTITNANEIADPAAAITLDENSIARGLSVTHTFSCPGGEVNTDVNGSYNRAYDTAIQSDGKIVVAGSAYNGSDYDVAVARYNKDGSLDASFGNDGIVIIDFFGYHDSAQSVAIQNDGKIVIVGSAYNGSDYDFAVARINKDGSLDENFYDPNDGIDDAGKVTTDFNSDSDAAYTAAIHDNKIIVAGSACVSGDTDFALARYNSDGTLDTTGFDGDGKVTTEFGVYNDAIYCIAIHDNKILVAGNGGTGDFALARYDSDGSLDTTFDSVEHDGKVTTSISSSYSAIRGISMYGNQIVVAGYYLDGNDFNLALARYNSDGDLDTTGFGTDGIVMDLTGHPNVVYDMIIHNDKILVAGFYDYFSSSDFALSRYNSNGSPDTDFGTAGVVTTDFTGDEDCAYSIAIQDSDKLVVVGKTYNGSDYNFALARYDITDGSPDTSFGKYKYGYTLSWTPEDVGTFPVYITATNDEGAYQTVELELEVVPQVYVSVPPKFTSEPEGPAIVNIPWSYTLTGNDPDQGNGDPPTFSITAFELNGVPSSSYTFMDNGNGTASFQWTPQSGDEGEGEEGAYIEFWLTDCSGVSTPQAFYLSVFSQASTSVPVFTTSAWGPAYVGETWTYEVRAYDPDGNDAQLTYELVEYYPEGMHLEVIEDPGGTYARITWVPEKPTDPATQGERVWIEAVDKDSDTKIQGFFLPVVAALADNNPPTFNTPTLGPMYKNRLFEFPLDVEDKNGHDFSYSVDPDLTTAPGFDNSNINENGLIKWTPAQSGDFNIAIVATDEYGASLTAVYQVRVLDNAIPDIKYGYASAAYVGTPYECEMTITDPNGDPFEVTLNPEAVSAGLYIDAPGPGSDVWTLRWDSPVLIDGGVPIVILAKDNHGGQAKLTFPVPLPVYDPSNNDGPQVSDSGVTCQIPATREFQFQVLVAIVSGASLNYDIVPKPGSSTTVVPDGIKITSSGLITWTPTLSQIDEVNPYYLRVVISDGVHETHLDFTLTVVAPEEYEPEVLHIDSTAPTGATAGQKFIYDPTVDSAISGLQWEIYVISGNADGMKVDKNTGRITWTPDSDMIGETVDVWLYATDSSGAGDMQAITLTVGGVNKQPQIDSSFPKSWRAGVDLEFDVLASDPEGHELVYELLTMAGEEVPSGLGVSMDEYGHITWDDPAENEDGYQYLVRVSEKHYPESVNECPFAIKVEDSTSVNCEPLIQGSPNEQYATVGELFEYQFTAVELDADDGGNPTWAIAKGDVDGAGTRMAIDPDTGKFTWTPLATEKGSHTITACVTDDPPSGRGDPKTTYVTFRLNVPDSPPQLNPTATVNTVKGVTMSYQVVASDPEGGPMKFAINYDHPEAQNVPGQTEMGIWPDSGELVWMVPKDLAEPLVVKVPITVTGKSGATATQILTINAAVTDEIAPTISTRLIDPDGNVYLPGDELATDVYYTFIVDVTDNSGAINENVGYSDITVVDVAMQEDPNDYQVIPPQTIVHGSNWCELTSTLNQGSVHFLIQATDGTGNKTTCHLTYYASEGDDAPAKIIEFHEQLTTAENTVNVIDVHDVITAPVNVWGTACMEDPDPSYDYYYYELILYRAEDSNKIEKVGDHYEIVAPEDFVVLQSGTSNIDGGYLGIIDPTLYGSGMYRLVLAIKCNCPNHDHYKAIDERIIEIRNDARPGTLDLSFTDLQVDLGGMPISLVRSYSSTAVDVGSSDFGPGWSLDFLNAGIQVAHPEKATNSLKEAMAGGTRIFITLPDGTIQRFTFLPEKIGNTGLYRIYFEPDNDVFSTLEIAGLDESLTLMPKKQESGNYQGPYVIANTNEDFIPQLFGSAFVLRTQSGLEYVYDTQTGALTAIKDDTGRSVSISVSGLDTTISSSSGGQTITITRDGNGRIDLITDPNSKDIDYEYSSDNLSRVTFRDGTNYVDYQYNDTTFPHHLTDILDAEGITVLHADYGDDSGEDDYGHLVRLEDASEQGTDFSFNVTLVDGKTVTRVNDGNGIMIDEVVDSQGKVWRRVQALDDNAKPTEQQFLVTVYHYNMRGLLTHESVPFVVTSAANRYTEEPVKDPADSGYDPSAWARIITYNDELMTTSQDALGNVTSFTYDDHNRLITTTDPLGNVTHNIYDPYTGSLLETYLTEGLKGTIKYNHIRYVYENGLLIETYQVGQEDPISSSDYDNGRIVSTTDIADQMTYYAYDNNGNQTHSWRNWIDPASVLPSLTVVTVTSYDDEGRSDGTAAYELAYLDPGSYSTYVDYCNAVKTALLSATPLWTTTTTYNSRGMVECSTDRYGIDTYSIYDVRGNLIETCTEAKNESNAAGWIITRTLYDEQGRVEFTTDSYFVLATSYDPTTPTSGGDVAWLGTRTVYDNLGRVTSTKRYDDVTIELFEDPEHTGQMKTDKPAGFDWDVDPTLLSSDETGYDDIGRVEYTIVGNDPDVSTDDARTDYYYDAAGRQIAVLGPVVLADIDGNGTEESVRLLSKSTFDSAGRLIQADTNIAVLSTSDDFITHPDLESANTDIDDSTMQSTFYEYDPAGRQTAVISTAVDDPDNPGDTTHLRTETVYDSFGRRLSVRENVKQTDPFNSETIYYDHDGDAGDFTEDYDTRVTYYEYDDAGNLTAVVLPEVEHPDGTTGIVHPRYEYTYDVYGNQTSILDNAYQTDPTDSGTIVYDHDGDYTDDTRITEFTYDAYGRDLSRTLPIGVAESSGFTETMAYDDFGLLDYAVSFEGTVTDYVYDTDDGLDSGDSGRLVAKHFFADTTAHANWLSDPGTYPAAEAVFYTYDAFGRLITTEEDTNAIPATIERTTTNEYDDEGRLLSVASLEGIVNYEYNEHTGLQERTWTSTSVAPTNAITDTLYDYDSLGRLTTVTVAERNDTPLGTPEVTSYRYDLAGNLDKVRLPNEVVSDYDYDAMNRLVKLTVFDDDDVGDWLYDDNNENLLAEYAYELALDGKRTGVVETDDDNVKTRVDWLYDNLGRLTDEDFDFAYDGETFDPDRSADYVYDLMGNRTKRSSDTNGDDTVDEIITYEYDANDRLLVEKTDSDGDSDVDLTTIYSYRTDAWGTTSNLLGGDQTHLMRKTTWEGDVPVNLTAGTFDPSGHSLSSKTQYAYNLQGRMSETVIDEDHDGDPDRKVEYEYGDDGIRVSQTEIEDTNDDNVFSETPDVTKYLYDSSNPTGYAQILEEKLSGSVNKTNTYTLGHDVLTQADDSVTPVIFHFLYDGHGSARALVDPTGAILTSGDPQVFRYDAFGNRLDTNEAITSILYSGEQTDATGLQYLRARYYDPAVGRFNRLDPFAGDNEDPQSLHKYLYAHANPINGVDPTGEFFLTLGASYLAATLANIQAEAGNLILQSLSSGDFAWDMFLYNAAIMSAPAVLGMAASFSGLWATIPKYRGAVELGELVGRGGDKLVYALRNSADEVLAVAKPTARALENIEKEIGTLATLRGMGFPTVGIKGVTAFQGQRAIVMERFAIGSKEILKAGGTTRYLNQRSIQGLKNIKRMMVDGRVWIDDLQFLFGRDGRVVIADSLNVIAGKGMSRQNKDIINKLIRLAGGTP